MRSRIVVECLDQRVLFERRLNDSTLDARAAAVDETDFPNARRVCRPDILLHYRADVTGAERVQIERILDRYVVEFVEIRHSAYLAGGVAFYGAGFSYEAVTTVPIPPRTEKSPTIVIRLGRQASTRSSRMRLVTAS